MSDTQNLSDVETKFFEPPSDAETIDYTSDIRFIKKTAATSKNTNEEKT